MRTRWLFSVGVAVTAGYLLLALHPRVQAADKPDPKAATVEFQDISAQPQPPGQPPIKFTVRLKYDLRCEIELAGLSRQFSTKSTITDGATAKFLAETYNSILEDRKGLQHKLNPDGRSITITGWKDPKTGKFYPVKRITFTSQTTPKGARMMPKANMPKVTNPKLPAA
jgi:hypothetical protein